MRVKLIKDFNLHKLTLLFILLFSYATTYASTFFNDNSVVEISLNYNISRLQAEKESLREDGLKGELTTLFDNKKYSVKVLARGAGSFDCQQPQLKIDFKKKEVKNSIFDGLNKVKLFTKGVCLETKTDSEQDKQIIANYLIYKLYEEFSDIHYKTRLLKINYSDSSGTIPDYTQYGFFLEPKKNLEIRLDSKYVDILGLQNIGENLPNRMDENLVSKVNAFEFLITNYDYGIPGFFSHIINDSGYPDILIAEKNSKVFEQRDGTLIPLIYDFDFSRFGYSAPMCMFGFRFFMNNKPFVPSCEVSHLKSIILEDLRDFKYSNDVLKNIELFINSLNQWKTVNEALIFELGAEYQTGLNNFIKALIEINNEENLQ